MANGRYVSDVLVKERFTVVGFFYSKEFLEVYIGVWGV